MPFAAVAGVSAGGSLLSGVLGGKAAKQAAQIQSQNAQQVAGLATNAAQSGQQGVTTAAQAAGTGATAAAGNASNLLQGIYGTESANLQPYLAAGTQGVSALQNQGNFAPPNPQDISSTPEYQFQLQQGLQALERSAAATGGLQGGGTQKGIAQYSEGLASTAYQQAYNNSLSTYNTNRQSALQLAGLGQTGTSQLQSAAQNYGNTAAGIGTQAAQYAGNTGLQGATTAGGYGLQGAQIAGQALTGGANAQAAGVVGQSNAYNSAIGGVANGVNAGVLGNYFYGGNSGYGNYGAPLSNAAYGQIPISGLPPGFRTTPS